LRDSTVITGFQFLLTKANVSHNRTWVLRSRTSSYLRKLDNLATRGKYQIMINTFFQNRATVLEKAWPEIVDEKNNDTKDCQLQ